MKDLYKSVRGGTSDGMAGCYSADTRRIALLSSRSHGMALLLRQHCPSFPQTQAHGQKNPNSES